MTLGGPPVGTRERCKNKPFVIATENKPDKDGRTGSMALCARCLEQFNKQMPKGFATISPIKVPS